MTEGNETLRIDYLIGRVDALQQVLRVLIATLPEHQQSFILNAAEAFADNRALSATTQDTDPARERAEAAWDTAQRLPADDFAEDFNARYRR